MKKIKLNACFGLAIIIVLTLACIQMAFLMPEGIVGAGNTAAERVAFIQSNLTLWQLGWINWMLAALGLLTFCVMLLPYIPKSEWRLLGILLVGLGVVPDLSAEMIFAFVIPHSHVVDPTLVAMQTLEQVAVQLTGTLGNGLYNIGGLILNMLLLNNPQLPRRLIIAGIPAWLFGLGLSVACAIQALGAAKIFTAIAMVWSTLWILAITLKIFPQAVRFRVAE